MIPVWGEAMRSAKLCLVAALVVVSGAACGGGGPAAAGPAAPSPRPASPAKLTILSPSSGEVIHGSGVHLKVRLVAATATKPAATQTGTAYIHVYLDGKIVSIEIVSMNDGVTEQAIHDVQPGPHLLRVELVGPDHLPFHPRVIAAVTFVAKR